MKKAKNIFFDLDGTLVDSREGIYNSVKYAFEKLGFTSPSKDAFEANIGPDFREYFSTVVGANNAETALHHYRQRYDVEGKCLTETTVYPSISFVLDSLKGAGRKLFVVTTKPHLIASKIVDHLGLSHYMKRTYGPELDGTRSNKADLIAYVLKQESIRPDEAVMVGDRKYDTIGAAKNGVKSIGVCWGYGTADELQQHGATVIINQPEELLETLLA